MLQKAEAILGRFSAAFRRKEAEKPLDSDNFHGRQPSEIFADGFYRIRPTLLELGCETEISPSADGEKMVIIYYPKDNEDEVIRIVRDASFRSMLMTDNLGSWEQMTEYMKLKESEGSLVIYMWPLEAKQEKIIEMHQGSR